MKSHAATRPRPPESFTVNVKVTFEDLVDLYDEAARKGTSCSFVVRRRLRARPGIRREA
jgi:hypothetical protein